MNYIQYNNPIHVLFRSGSADDPYVFMEDVQKIVNNSIVLTELPDEINHVFISGYTEIYKGEPTSTQFRVDYRAGIVKFNPSEEGKTVTALYMGRGLIFYPASRIWTKESGNEIIETLQDVIDKNGDAIRVISEFDELVEQAESVKTGLENGIAVGNTLRTNLQTDVTEGNNLHTTLGIDIENANTVKSNLENQIDISEELYTRLNTTITDANTAENQLEIDIVNADVLHGFLQTDITTGNSLKADLENKIATGNSLSTTLNTDIENANLAKQNIEESITSGNTLHSNLQDDIATGNNLHSTLSDDIADATLVKNDLNTKITVGSALHSNLENDISEGNNLHIDLQTDITDVTTKKEALETTINDAVSKNTTLNTTISNANNVKNNLDNSISSGQITKSNLDSSISEANSIKDTLANPETGIIKQANDINTELNDSILNANTVDDNLNDSIINAQSADSILKSTITTANTTKGNLDNSITNANTSKTNLDTSISNANTARTNLNTSITNANTAKSNLDGSISDANTIKSNLDTSIDSAETINSTLGSTIDDAEATQTILNGAVQQGQNKIQEIDAKLLEVDTEMDEVENTRLNLENTEARLEVFEPYDNTKVYYPLNKVSYNGSSYVCVQQTTAGIDPTNSTYWIVIAQKGKDGVGSGDMNASVYDTNTNGIVDNAEKLGGNSPSYYETVTGSQTKMNTVQENLDTHKTSSDHDERYYTETEVDTKLAGKVDKVTGKQLSTEDYTTAEKNKLAGIEAGANKYVHPSTHSPSIIAQDVNNRFVSDTEKNSWNNKAEISDIPTKTSQLINDSDFTTNTYVNGQLDNKVDKVTGKQLSTEDYTTAEKNKLAGIEAGANKYVHPSTHSPSIIAQDTNNRFVSDVEKATWNGKQDALGYTPENIANKGKANGYADLDANGKIPLSRIPDLSLNKTTVVNSYAERDAITGQKTGDRCIVLLSATSREGYIWDGSQWLLDSDTDWQNISLDWVNIQNKPDSVITLTGDVSGSGTMTDLGSVSIAVTVADDSHNHVVGNIDGLQSILDGKQSVLSGDVSGHYHSNDRNRANHTGTQTASTISDFASTVRSTVLTGLSTATNAVITASDSILSALGKLQKQISDNLATLTAHIGNKNNPHEVNKTQIGLGNVDNTSDLNKPISTATQTALDGKANVSDLHFHNNKNVLDGFSEANGQLLYNGEEIGGGSGGVPYIEDSVTGERYKWTIENGMVYLERVVS